jgi:hypothetical protein
MRKPSTPPVILNAGLILIFTIGIGFCLYLISSKDLSNRESTMMGILLTILSTLVSWILTHIYSASQYQNTLEDVQEQHRTNLRTYALKAAEKVNNLSNELNKLSIYLEQELNWTDYQSQEEELYAKEERIESAIHLIRTLKSVNDTSLSDWEGVIADELSQQKEEREEKEEQLKEIIEKVEHTIEDQRQDFLGTQRDAENIKQQIFGLKNELRVALMQLSDTTLPKRISTKGQKQEITIDCPVCKSQLKYKQKPKERGFKSIPCSNCGSKLISRFTQGKGFVLNVRQVEKITVKCPACETPSEISLDNFPGSTITISCANCSKSTRVIRVVDGVEGRLIEKAGNFSPTSVGQQKADEIDEITLGKVKNALPSQPWAQGTHKDVSVTLGLPQPTVRRAMQILIKRGDFLPQIDGIVYRPVLTKDSNPLGTKATQ